MAVGEKAFIRGPRDTSSRDRSEADATILPFPLMSIEVEEEEYKSEGGQGAETEHAEDKKKEPWNERERG